MCCENPINLGCFNSCEKITITTINGYDANELKMKFNFNGAIKSILITEVEDSGSTKNPIIDLSLLNEDYEYTFEIVDIATGESLGCFKMKVLPCAGDFDIIPTPPPITNNVDTIFTFLDNVCNVNAMQDFRITVTAPTLAGIVNGSIFNISISADFMMNNFYLSPTSSESNIEILSQSQFRIIDASIFTGEMNLYFTYDTCSAGTISGKVTLLENLASGWVNGTHTPATKIITS